MSNRGRFQAQGDGVEQSEAWAQDIVITKTEAEGRIDNLAGRLTRREFEVRDIAFQKAKKFVNVAPASGYPAVISKSYSSPGVRSKIRVDIEIWEGYAFCDDTEENEEN